MAGEAFGFGAESVLAADAGEASDAAELDLLADDTATTCEGGNCFLAGTLVQMADGTSKPIEQVKIGDQVVSHDPNSGKSEAHKVVGTKIRPVTETLKISFSDSSGKIVDVIHCTPEHPFYVDGKGFTAAGDLAIGNSIVTRAGPDVTIASIDKEQHEKFVSVYNLTIEGDHTYFVGQIGELVHNYTPSGMGILAQDNGFEDYIRGQYPYSDFMFVQGTGPGADVSVIYGEQLNLFDPEWNFAELKPDNANGVRDGYNQIDARLRSGYKGPGQLYVWSGAPGAFRYRPYGALRPDPNQLTLF